MSEWVWFPDRVFQPSWIHIDDKTLTIPITILLDCHAAALPTSAVLHDGALFGNTYTVELMLNKYLWTHCRSVPNLRVRSYTTWNTLHYQRIYWESINNHQELQTFFAFYPYSLDGGEAPRCFTFPGLALPCKVSNCPCFLVCFF